MPSHSVTDAIRARTRCPLTPADRATGASSQTLMSSVSAGQDAGTGAPQRKAAVTWLKKLARPHPNRVGVDESERRGPPAWEDVVVVRIRTGERPDSVEGTLEVWLAQPSFAHA